MNVSLTPEDLIKFEDDVCAAFADKKIRAPVHLDNGNEKQLIKVFQTFVNENDWVMGSWRQHYKCLLKGVPPADLMQAIIEGKSISLCFPQYKIISSAIVGGILPIAVGAAMGIKRQGDFCKVVCFLGEMTSETGAFHEALKYSLNHDLPIIFVIEDNEKSVCTPTLPVWNQKELTHQARFIIQNDDSVVYQVNPKTVYYKYTSKYPHAGTGARINF